ncbi:TolC family protein [Legionella sp. W05-934-2]|jgi:outer membrane protein TolC|uniref:TolC family protein n=1 Tax=Legionella sp. W05-934-2 TaxID=1198649 RepID=UPI003462AF7B
MHLLIAPWIVFAAGILASACLHASELVISKNPSSAEQRLVEAIDNPEYMLTHWIELPLASDDVGKNIQRLSLDDAILIALRYNPNIQNKALDRIIQRYRLRLAENQFELQYALSASANANNDRYEGVGSQKTYSALASPEIDWQSKLGGKVSLKMDNTGNTYDNYHPTLNFSFTQPLLRGFGKINEASLLDARDQEYLNKLNLNQSVADQITAVISNYRSLILSGNNLITQKRQLEEAKKQYEINEKKIRAGQLERTANIQQSYQVESLRLAVEQAINQFENASQTLLQNLGLNPLVRISVPDDVSIHPIETPELQGTIDYALAHNVAYQAQKLVVKADERAYEVAKNQQLWKLDLSANVQTGTVTNVDQIGRGIKGIYDGRNVSESARINLTIPLGDVSLKSKLINAKVKLEQDRTQLLASKRALISQVTTLINNIKSQAKRYQLAEKQVKLARQAYQLQIKRQSAGIATSLDVNNTQNQLINAQNSLINAKINYLNQLSELDKVLGTTLQTWHINLRYGQ